MTPPTTAVMYKRALTKPDGRRLILYSREPLVQQFEAPSPNAEPLKPNAHLRWHPLRGEWVAYAGHRQNRTFLPPPEYNPLAPTADPNHPTELPAGRYDVAVFENMFPTLTPLARDPPDAIVPTRPATGSCEVVVFTQDPSATLGSLPLSHLVLLFEVWADRYSELGARADVQYVFPFENRGVEVGVTLHHPHGQIYAYPFVPPIAARELQQQREYLAKHGSGLLFDHLEAEVADGRRVLYVSGGAIAVLPVCARYPYEVWVAPRRAAPSLSSITPDERAELARALKTVLMKFDALWQKPFPYIMVFHQAPTDGQEHPEAHLHIELYPAYRMTGRLKYLAGSEVGAGVFTADTLPEEKARELQAVQVSIDR
jgi:UDPglucose--hexose-1-phosphate uridylyltransferase